MTESENIFARKELDRLSSLLKEYNDKLRESLGDSLGARGDGSPQGSIEFRSMYDMYGMLQHYASEVLERHDHSQPSPVWLEARVRLVELRDLLNRMERKTASFDPVLAIPLLKEYTQWMATSIERVFRYLDKDPRRRSGSDSSAEAIMVRFHNLRGPLMNLARSFSQSIEHSDLKDSIRIELELRLADFESMIEVLSRQSSRM